MSALFNFRCERQKCFFRIWCVMQNPDAERIVEDLLERQFENVALNDMYVRCVTRECKRRFNTVTEIGEPLLAMSTLNSE